MKTMYIRSGDKLVEEHKVKNVVDLYNLMRICNHHFEEIYDEMCRNKYSASYALKESNPLEYRRNYFDWLDEEAHRAWDATEEGDMYICDEGTKRFILGCSNQ